MIFIIMMVLFVTCCSQLVSKSYYGQVRLLAYALFTKIPITKEANEYVTEVLYCSFDNGRHLYHGVEMLILYFGIGDWRSWGNRF